MPKTTPRPEPDHPATPGKDNAPKYVRCELSPDQKAQLALWADEQEEADMVKWVDAHIKSGHTLSIRSNEVGYQVSLTGVREGSGHVGLCLIARASTPMRAIYSCWFKDEVVLQGKWPASNAISDLDF